MGRNFGIEYTQHHWMLAVVQDLLNRVSSAEGKLNSSDVVGSFYRDTYADVRAIPSDTKNAIAFSFGRDALGDGIVSIFDWDASGIGADDGGNSILRPNDFVDAGSMGVWVRRQ